MKRLTVGLVILLLVGACSDDDAGPTTTTVTPTTTVETTAITPTTATETPATTIATTTVPATTMPATTIPATSVPATTIPAITECSAAGMDFHWSEDHGLPEPVDQMRRAIVAAAVACDIEALAALGLDGAFVWALNPNAAEHPADYWRFLEYEYRSEPLYELVLLFTFPWGVVDVGTHDIYVWPSAEAYDDWKSVPEEERDAIVWFLGEEYLETIELENYYLGPSVGIDDSGDWLWVHEAMS